MILQNRYILHNVIGKGGMGTVYRATDRISKQDVALKRVHQDTNIIVPLHHSKIEEELAAEFRLLASLRHPHIIPVIDFGFDEQQRPFYTMRLLQQPQTILEAGQNLPFIKRLGLLCQALRALAYLHRRGILHRDIKPSNLLVEEETLFMLDFGLALPQLRAEGTAGTLLYTAPESLKNNQTTVASDIYAMGLIAFQLFSQLPVYELPTSPKFTQVLQIIETQPIPLERLFEGIDEDDETYTPQIAEVVRALISSMVHKNPTQRAIDARALLQRFVELIGESVREETTFLLEMPQFVGRQQEYNTLLLALEKVTNFTRSIWDFAKTQTDTPIGSAWLIGGEGGVGKTRLLQEIELEALTKGFLVLRGQYTDQSADPYSAWYTILQHLILHSSPTGLHLSILQHIMPNLKQIGQIVPPVPIDDSWPQRLVAAVVNLFQNLTVPTLLVVEDLHFANDGLILLDALAAVVEELPLVIIATYRDDEAPLLPQHLPHLQLMRLERLDSKTLEKLVTQLLGYTPERAFIQWLMGQTEGNPFFLIETLRTLTAQTDGIERVPQLPRPKHFIPRSLEPHIQQRLQKVSELDRDLLAIAAVMGREINLDVLQQFSSGLEDELEHWLLRCADAYILRYEDGVWRFTHDKLRDGVLASLEPERLRVARWCAVVGFEDIYANAPHMAQRLYELYRTLEVPERAQYYALEAAKHAQSNFDWDSAISWYRAASTWEAELPLPTEAKICYASVLIQRNHLQEAFSIIENTVATSKLTAEQEAFIEALKATLMLKQQHYLSALHHGIRAVSRYRQQERQRAAARAMFTVAEAHRALGNFSAAYAYHQRILKIYQQTQDLVGQSYALAQLAMDAYLEDDLQTAHELITQAEALTTPDIGLKLRFTSLKGMIACAQERYFAAISYFQQSLDLAHTLRDQEQIARNFVFMGRAHTALNDYETGYRYYHKGLALAYELSPVHPIAMEALVGIAHWYLQKGIEHHKAAQWLHAVYTHPLSTAHIRRIAHAIRKKYTVELPASSGQAPKFEEIVQQHLNVSHSA